MSEHQPPEAAPEEPDRPEQPAWDREAARARYRRFMRSWPMRLSYVVLIAVLLFAWGWGIAAAFAPDVENLAGHDVSVPVVTCVTCHTTGAEAAGAPAMNHPQAPSCGFCHRQSFPEGIAPAGGWVRRPHPLAPSPVLTHRRGGTGFDSPSPVASDGRGG